ncbi:helix-turn-helix domain-containing protein [Roseovarius sp. C7]|uniref:helix-turn-helix domain-containing protein n=1 Tax=Roseovarius sp. C7 TaxID=3398643 RepID=UPI0039F504AB
MPNHHEGQVLSAPLDMDTLEMSRADPGLGAEIRNLRKAKRLTLGALAEATGLSPGFISQIERAQNSSLGDGALSDQPCPWRLGKLVLSGRRF